MAIQRWRHTYYTPEDDVVAIVRKLPTLAQHSVDVECYGFTDSDFVDALIIAAQRGVVVRVMNDHIQSTGHADHALLQRLIDTHLPNIAVKVVSSIHGAIDHLKIIIIDGVLGAMANESSVVGGSFNFSGETAEKQDNLLSWSNDPGEVQQALDKFNLDWQTNKQAAAWQIAPTPPS